MMVSLVKIGGRFLSVERATRSVLLTDSLTHKLIL